MNYDEEMTIYRVFIELLKRDPRTEQVCSISEIRSTYRLLKKFNGRKPTARELFISTSQLKYTLDGTASPQLKTFTIQDAKKQRKS
jgi:hypothetical protein